MFQIEIKNKNKDIESRIKSVYCIEKETRT